MVWKTAFIKKSEPKSKTFKAYNTGYSQAVSHPGTNLALQGLTAVIGREPVFFFSKNARMSVLFTDKTVLYIV